MGLVGPNGAPRRTATPRRRPPTWPVRTSRLCRVFRARRAARRRPGGCGGNGEVRRSCVFLNTINVCLGGSFFLKTFGEVYDDVKVVSKMFQFRVI